MLELSLAFLARLNFFPVELPTYSLQMVQSRFWSDRNPSFGVWHPPMDEYRHRKSCFDVVYQSNSYGARDVARSIKSTRVRGVLLGDSFVEGFGIANEKRMSNLLEDKLQMDVLNFGTSGHFGMTQSSLLYEHLAKKFDHDLVLISILPDNDFLDDDPEYAKEHFQNRFRPYYLGEYPNYTLEYFGKEHFDDRVKNEVSAKRILREFSHTYHFINFLQNRLKQKFLSRDASKAQTYSGYFDFTPRQFDRLQFSLEKILQEAKGKEVLIFTIPRYRDFLRFETGVVPPVVEQLQFFAEQHQVEYKDLSACMVAKNYPVEDFFLTCDAHWNELGNQLAAACINELFFHPKN